MKKDDFRFHGVSVEENERLSEKAYSSYLGDVHGEGGQFVMSERPKFDKGSSLWHTTTTAVEAYIKLLEDRIIALGLENKELQDELTAVKRNRELTMKWARGELEN